MEVMEIGEEEKKRIVDEILYDSNKRHLKRSRRYWMWTVIPLSLGLLWLVFSFYHQKELGAELENLNSNVVALKDSIVERDSVIINYSQEISQANEQFEVLYSIDKDLQNRFVNYLEKVNENHLIVHNTEESFQKYLKGHDLLKTFQKQNNNIHVKKVDANEVVQTEVSPASISFVRPSYFNPDGYNRIYHPERGGVLLMGDFKNGNLWNGKHFVYRDDGLFLKMKIVKEGVYIEDKQQ